MAENTISTKEQLELRKQELEALLKSCDASLSVEDKKDEIVAAVKEALGSVEDADKLLSANYAIVQFNSGNINHGWQIDLHTVQSGKKRGPKSGNGTGNTNFEGKPVTVHSDELAAEYGLEKREFPSMRALYLEIGGEHEEDHPDNVLRRDHKRLWADISGESAPSATASEPTPKNAKPEESKTPAATKPEESKTPAATKPSAEKAGANKK